MIKGIPKLIHYCWFGNNEKTDEVKKMISTWKKFCPEYKIIEWNESNFNLNECIYVKQAYECKKYAFVSDYVRVKVLYQYGGIYLDTDVELLDSLDKFLDNRFVMCFQDSKYLNTGLILAESNSEILKEILNYYKSKSFLADGKQDLTSNPVIFTHILKENGMKIKNEIQKNDKFLILSNDFFCPLNYETRKLIKTNNTVSIHWFSGTWLSNRKRIKSKVLRIIKNIIGLERYNKIKNTMKCK